MKLKFTKRRIAAAALNIMSLAGFMVLTQIGSSQAESQQYNYAAERWENGDESDSYAQISCFFPESADFTTDSVGSARAGVLNALKTVSMAPEEGQKLCPDAYSAEVGQATVKGDITGRSEAEITAVGGDFFLIHNFTLLDGAFFSDEDVMQDGAVIDRSLAWALYGSHEVSGMKLTINGVQFYISGVIETPQTDEEQQCAGELPRAYISYDGATAIAAEASADTGSAQERFNSVTCYEILMPDPVESYAFQSIEVYMESLDCGAAVIQNSGRFEVFKRLGAIKNISDTAVQDSGIVYPWWENASRITEFRLSFICLGAALCLAVPTVTVLWLIVRGYRALKRNKKRFLRAALNLLKKGCSLVKSKISCLKIKPTSR
ncbi:MAG: ABC transporter permease [Ruminococcus sp.]|nr:ABC transporter permease [Ruminococcus sp.]